MGFLVDSKGVDEALRELSAEYRLFAPRRFAGGGAFSDTDCVRYGEIRSVSEIVFDEKSRFSFKEVLNPISQTLFYFTEDSMQEPEPPSKGSLIFLRSCDLHAVRRLDEIYLRNGSPDYYYSQRRNKVRFALMGCKECFESCFCVDMGTNRADSYDFSIDPAERGYLLDCKAADCAAIFSAQAKAVLDVVPAFVTETKTRVSIPENLDARAARSKMWDEYDKRCINCGRCNFSCPTCTCFTMQDLFYQDNSRAGERRRVAASCMVDGFTDVAGGGSCRKTNGQRMRFKVLHKVLDFRRRSGFNMCVGCGRCDDVCPEYISFSHCVNRLADAMKEVAENDAK